MTDYEKFLGALVLWREARGESIDARTAVWHVILNRTVDPQRRWPRTISGVILQPLQFSSMTAPGDPGLRSWPTEPTPTQESAADWRAFGDCQNIVETDSTDNSEGSNMYHSDPPGQEPYWVKDSTPTVTFGALKFYRLN